MRRQKKKPPEGRLLNSILMMAQTAINAGFNLRRNAMKATPAKPMIIMAHTLMWDGCMCAAH